MLTTKVYIMIKYLNNLKFHLLILVLTLVFSNLYAQDDLPEFPVSQVISTPIYPNVPPIVLQSFDELDTPKLRGDYTALAPYKERGQEEINDICVRNPIQFKGTGLNWSGGGGALTLLDETGTIKLPGDIVTSPTDPEFAATTTSGYEYNNVAIIVVDDFGDEGTMGDLSDDMQILDDLANGSLSIPDAFAQLENLQTTGGQHGPLVLNHLLQLVNSTDEFEFYDISVPSTDTIILQLVSTETLMLIKAVNVSSEYEPELIVDRTQEAIDTIVSEYGINHFVINMSFNLVPCVVVEDFENSDTDEIEVYVDTIFEQNEDVLEEAFPREDLLAKASEICASDDDEATVEFCEDIESDPEVLVDIYVNTELLCFITTPMLGGEDDIISPFIEELLNSDDIEVEFVSAAGNFSRPCPFYPARLRDVISVSSLDILSTSQPMFSSFSNQGEDVAPGAWFWLTDFIEYYQSGFSEDPIGTSNFGVGIVYGGTSFATPHISLEVAYEMAFAEWSQDDHNRHTYAQNGSPPLRYYCDISFNMPSPVSCP